ncbi:MAG TPA: ammonium transporter, partial [Novosphingobium sp.]|nr:ammonium transporter [Novosphingobium sp.]
MRKIGALGLATVAALMPVAALAQDALDDVADSGDTAWILTSAALVLLMTMPGLTLFYGGLVRTKNFLSVMVQVGAIAAIASLLWIVCGYSVAFGHVTNGWLGAGNAWMLLDLGNVREGTAIPESAFALFQMIFAAITPALMVGAWVDRARFGWVVGFSALWGLAVYAPVAHWLWGGGWLSAAMGTKDFAGGIVVHTTAGVSALVAALLLGKRQGFPRTLMLPHSPSLTMVGAAMLWMGWFGFMRNKQGDEAHV